MLVLYILNDKSTQKMVVNTALLFIQITILSRDSVLGKRSKVFSKIDVY